MRSHVSCRQGDVLREAAGVRPVSGQTRCAADLERQNHAIRLKTAQTNRPRGSVVRYPPAALSRSIALNQFLAEDLDS